MSSDSYKHTDSSTPAEIANNPSPADEAVKDIVPSADPGHIPCKIRGWKPLPEGVVPQTLEELLDAIKQHAHVTPLTLRRLRASANRLARMAGTSLREIPVAPPAFQKVIGGLRNSAHDLTLKSVQNILADVRAMARWARVLDDSVLAAGAISPEWSHLISLLPPPGWQGQRLYAMARWATKVGIRPQEVTEQTFTEFAAYRAEHTYTIAHRSYVNAARAVWNIGHKRIPNWPGRYIGLIHPPKSYSLPVEQLGAEFRADLEKWALTVSNPGPFESRFRAVAPRTIHERRNIFLRLYTLLLRRDRVLKSLADLTKPDVCKEALLAFYEHSGHRWTLHAVAVASAIWSLVNQYVDVPPEDSEKIHKLTRAVRPPKQGLGFRVESRLAVLDDPANLQKAFGFPHDLMTIAERLDAEVRGALLAMYATILLLTSVCLVRRNNVVRIHLDRHMQYDRAGAPIGFRIPGEEVKNREPLERIFDDTTKEFVALYLSRFRPVLASEANRWLFPGHDDGPILGSTVGHAVRRLSLRYLGFELNLHLYRHVGAMIAIEADPSSLAEVQRMLGHRNWRTTESMYGHLRSRGGFRKHAENIAKLLESPTRRRRGRKNGGA